MKYCTDKIYRHFMNNKLIPVKFQKIMQTRLYTVIILSAQQKQFAIYTESSIGKTIQNYLTESEKVRPMTHDLLNMILTGLDVQIVKIVIYDLKDTVYFAKLYLSKEELNGMETFLEIDVRPSDSIALAVLNHVPIYCTQEVLEQTVPFEDDPIAKT